MPFIDREFRTLASRDHRGCFGKSSGGYGSIIHGMRYPETWGAIADHSGDAYFDLCYLADWPRTLNELDKYRRKKRRPGPIDAARDATLAADGRDDGRVRRFLAAMWEKDKLSDAEIHAVMELAMAASYDPDRREALGFRVPFNLETGELLPKRWARWLEHDPVQLVGKFAAQPQDPARHFHRLRLARPIPPPLRRQAAVEAPHRPSLRHIYEEFDDNHSSIDYRMDVSLPFLYRALK